MNSGHDIIAFKTILIHWREYLLNKSNCDIMLRAMVIYNLICDIILRNMVIYNLIILSKQ